MADAIRWVEQLEPVIDLVETTSFIHTDHIGTPRQVTDDSQTVVWRWDSTPFGDSAPNEDPDGDFKNLTLNLRFPGQYYDVESGLHYNYFRTYDPSIGRYIESDPAGMIGGTNTFWYVMNRPIELADKFGLFPIDDDPFGSEPLPRSPMQEPIVSWMCSEFGNCPEQLTPCEKRCYEYRDLCYGLSPFAGAAAGHGLSAACNLITRGVVFPLCQQIKRPASVAAASALITTCFVFGEECLADCQVSCEQQDSN